MRGDQLVRQWRIIQLLENRKKGYSVAELSAKLETAKRNVYRDLDALQSAGFPLYSEHEDGRSSWRLVSAFKTGLHFPFTPTELMALHVSRDLMAVFEGTAFHESLETFFAKVKAALPPQTMRYLENIAGRLTIGLGSRKAFRGFKEVIKRVSEAVAQRKQIEIRYRAASTGRETTRRVNPYQVWVMGGSFYLIGYCHLRDSVRTFSLDRISSLRELDEQFRFPKDFSLDDYLQTAFRVMRGQPETIKVRFGPGAAEVVKERIWHPTQEIRDRSDGGVVVTLRVPVNYEVISWILGFGSAAEVLEPLSLKERIVGELQSAIETYRDRPRPISKEATGQ